LVLGASGEVSQGSSWWGLARGNSSSGSLSLQQQRLGFGWVWSPLPREERWEGKADPGCRHQRWCVPCKEEMCARGWGSLSLAGEPAWLRGPLQREASSPFAPHGAVCGEGARRAKYLGWGVGCSLGGKRSTCFSLRRPRVLCF